MNQFYSAELRKQYTNKQNSFYLGYLTHLITDMMWAERIFRPAKMKFKDIIVGNQADWIWAIKKDWYDLDFLYIIKNPEFRAFLIYRDSVGFKNTYMDFLMRMLLITGEFILPGFIVRIERIWIENMII